MNSIQNHSSANINTNCRKASNDISFKAFVKTKAANEGLTELLRILNKKPTNELEARLLENSMNFVNLINQFKPIAEKSKFYDLVLDYIAGWGKNMNLVFGIKKSFSDTSTKVSQATHFSCKDNIVFMNEGNPKNALSLKVNNKYVAKELVQRLNCMDRDASLDNTRDFLELYKMLESRSQLELKGAKDCVTRLITE